MLQCGAPDASTCVAERAVDGETSAAEHSEWLSGSGVSHWVRHRRSIVFPLLSWLRHHLSVLIPLLSWRRHRLSVVFLLFHGEGAAFLLCFHCFRGEGTAFLFVFPLLSWRRHRLSVSVLFPLLSWAFETKTPPLLCVSAAFAAKALPLPCFPLLSLNTAHFSCGLPARHQPPGRVHSQRCPDPPHTRSLRAHGKILPLPDFL